MRSTHEKPKRKKLESSRVSKGGKPRGKRGFHWTAIRSNCRGAAAGDNADQDPPDSQHWRRPEVGAERLPKSRRFTDLPIHPVAGNPRGQAGPRFRRGDNWRAFPGVVNPPARSRRSYSHVGGEHVGCFELLGTD